MELLKELKSKLTDGVVKFTYRKKDGTERKATGTTKLSEIPEQMRPQGGYDTPDTTTRYYDLDANGWRSFINENLVAVG